MRHHRQGKKFHRKRGERRAFLGNLVNNFVRRERITTTETRAKALRPFVERLVTIAKQQTLAGRRILIERTGSVVVAHKLYEEIGPRYAGRSGGYVRVVKLGKGRKRDGTRLAVLEFV